MINKVSKLISQLVREALLEAQDATGVRLRNEMQLAQEIAASLDEQEEEEEEEETVEVDVEDEPPEPAADNTPTVEDEPAEEEVEVATEDEPPAEPKAKRKMSPPSVATGLAYKDFKHNFNIIRSARALSKTVNGEVMITKTGDRMRNYFEALDEPEKKALQKFMVGLAQVLVVGKPAKYAIHPDIEKGEPTPTTSAKPQKPSADVEIGSTPPIRVVGSKLEGLLRSSRRLIK
jgi:hypothetical protein